MSTLNLSVACKYFAHQPNTKHNDAGYKNTIIKIMDESFQ
jgi:hypothetical protein